MASELDRDCAAKQAAKYDPEMEKEVVDWIEKITGEKKGDAKIEDWLHDGKVLIKLVNAIKPGTVKKTNEESLPFKQMENITRFTDAARDWGVPESSMFGTPDLYEAKNMTSVVRSLYTFGGAVQVHCPEFSGPKLGVPLKVEAKTHKRETHVATQSGGYTSTLDAQKAHTNARGMGVDASTLAGGPDAVGLDADLKKKQAESYPKELEIEVVAWMEAILGESKGDMEVAEWLHDGKVLCRLVNKFEEGKIKKINEQKMPFKQMENITNFMNVAREWKVPEFAMFGTPDLYEEKNMGSVIKCLYAFGGAIPKQFPSFDGPKLGIQAVDAHDQKRNDGACTDQNESMQRTMEVERPKNALKR